MDTIFTEDPMSFISSNLNSALFISYILKFGFFGGDCNYLF